MLILGELQVGIVQAQEFQNLLTQQVPKEMEISLAFSTPYFETKTQINNILTNRSELYPRLHSSLALLPELYNKKARN